MSAPQDLEVPLVYTPGSVAAAIEFLGLTGLNNGVMVAKRSMGVDLPWIEVTPGNPLLDIDVIEVFFSFRNRMTGAWTRAQYDGKNVSGRIYYLQPGKVATMSLYPEKVTPSLESLSTWQTYDQFRLQVRVDFDGGVLESAVDEMVMSLDQDLPAVEGKRLLMTGFLRGSPPASSDDLPEQQWKAWTEEHHNYLDQPLIRIRENSPGSDLVFFTEGFVPDAIEHRQAYQLLVKLDTNGDGGADYQWEVPRLRVIAAAEREDYLLSPQLAFVDGLPVVQ